MQSINQIGLSNGFVVNISSDTNHAIPIYFVTVIVNGTQIDNIQLSYPPVNEPHRQNYGPPRSAGDFLVMRLRDKIPSFPRDDYFLAIRYYTADGNPRLYEFVAYIDQVGGLNGIHGSFAIGDFNNYHMDLNAVSEPNDSFVAAFSVRKTDSSSTAVKTIEFHNIGLDDGSWGSPSP